MVRGIESRKTKGGTGNPYLNIDHCFNSFDFKYIQQYIMKDIYQEIIEIAQSNLGQEEIRGNLGFKDKRFQEHMENTGWEKGQAWCAYFGELVWKQAYSVQNSLIVPELDKLFSGSAVTTFNNFKRAGWTVHQSSTPKPGSLVIWQKHIKSKPHWSGHLGIFERLQNSLFKSIEGNTNDDGSREGYEVARRTRPFNYKGQNGLVLLGFVEPKIP